MTLTAAGKKDEVRQWINRTLYLGLLKTTGGAQMEFAGDGYARVGIQFADWTIAAATGIATNNIIVMFPTPLAPWGTPSHLGVYAASSDGDALSVDALGGSPAAIVANQLVRFLTGRISISPAS